LQTSSNNLGNTGLQQFGSNLLVLCPNYQAAIPATN